MNLMKRIMQTLFVIAVLTFFSQSAFAKLSFPYDTEPFATDSSGVSASRDSGGHFRRPERGYFNLIYWIGTGTTPGSLILDFENPFTDAVDKDFAILTDSESWGPLADIARFEFFLNDTLQGWFDAELRPDELFEFELPGNGIIANRIVITNITPDPDGVNNLATMTFTDAGVAYPLDPGAISGMVTDQDTGNPLEEATVSANSYSNPTNSTGYYTITLPLGIYALTASKAGYEEKTEEGVEVAAGKTTLVDFHLTRINHAPTISGLVNQSGIVGVPWKYDISENISDSNGDLLIVATDDPENIAVEGYVLAFCYQTLINNKSVVIKVTDPGGLNTSQTIYVSVKGAEKTSIYPNPYIAGKGYPERIIFGGLPKEATLRIYTISGELVKEISPQPINGGSVEWDVSGISSGIYLYTIISPGGKNKGRVSIVK